MFNPSFCQELFKRQPARRHPNFPSGTHNILVGTNGVLVGEKRQSPVSQSVAKVFDKEGRKTQKRRFV